MAVYLLQYKPLESPRNVHIEVMNECTILSLTYMLLCFTDLVDDVEARIIIGYGYMGVTIANIIIHLVLILLASGQKMRLVCKRYRCCLSRSVADRVKKAPLPKDAEESKQVD